MGNCQAISEVAAVVVQHPGDNGKVEKMYWKISAHEVMGSNPGYYVALVVDLSSENVNANNSHSPTVKQQYKLLRPTDTLHVGHVYRLISFEDVIKELTAKKPVKLGKLLKESGVINSNAMEQDAAGSSVGRGVGSRRVGRHHQSGGGQWKPALQSIAEVGS